MIKGILFDFDGTLIDTMVSFQKIAGRVINQYYSDIPVEDAEKLYIETSGIPFLQQIEIIKPKGEHNKTVVDQFEQEKLDNFFNETFEEDVRTTLTNLHEKGYKIGVSSGNFTDLIIDFVQKEDVFFDIIMGFEEGFEKGKDHFDFFLNKVNLQKNELLFVGDSIKDGERAYDYGIKFFARSGIFSEKRFKKRFDEKQIVLTQLSEIWKYLD